MRKKFRRRKNEQMNIIYLYPHGHLKVPSVKFEFNVCVNVEQPNKLGFP